MEIEDGKPLFSIDEVDNLDTTLGEIIHAGLVAYKVRYQLNAKKGNVDSVPEAVVQYCIDKKIIPPVAAPSQRHMDLVERMWLSILDMMIFSYGADYPKPDEFGVNYETQTLRPGVYTFTMKNDAKGQLYVAAMTDHEDRKLIGRRYFATYFGDLWL